MPRRGGTIVVTRLFPPSNAEAGSRGSLGVAGPASCWAHIMTVVKGWLGSIGSVALALL